MFMHVFRPCFSSLCARGYYKSMIMYQLNFVPASIFISTPQDAVIGSHVTLHCRHAPGHVSIMIAGHHHTVVLTNMVVQHGVIRHPEFTEGTKPHCDSVYPIRACVAASLQCLLRV